MAKAAGIDPKRFRQALRDEEFDWHIHGASWTVNRSGPEHLDMERVLRRLVPDSPQILWSRRSWTTSALWVGADPGGKDAFGLAFLDASGGLNCTTVSSVDEATGRIIQQGEPLALGIDAPMWWSSGKGGRPQGRRIAPQEIRHSLRNRAIGEFAQGRGARRRHHAGVPRSTGVPFHADH